MSSFHSILHKLWLHHSHSSTTPLPRVNMVISTPSHWLFSWPPHKKDFPKSYTLLFLILLSGDIATNPGPPTLDSPTFTLCTLNIRSLPNSLHYTAISDLAQTRHINLFALTETWITPSTTLAELADATPPDFTLISTPRPVSPANLKQKIIGGGTAFLVHNSCTIISSSSQIFKSFEMSSITIKLLNSKLTVFNIYRNHYLPNTSKKSVTHHPKALMISSIFWFSCWSAHSHSNSCYNSTWLHHHWGFQSPHRQYFGPSHTTVHVTSRKF